MEIIQCKKCGKKFSYKVWGTAYPGGKERETANCPYCGEVGYSEVTSKNITVNEMDS